MALSIKKHPIHPMLVGFPISLFSFSLISDIIYVSGGGQVWMYVANYTMAGGVLFGIVAAIPGLVDLYSMPAGGKARELGVWHMCLNLGIVVLFALNLYLRSFMTGAMVFPLMLSFVGVAGLLISGWLGGEMVYRYGAGIDVKEDEHEQTGRVVDISEKKTGRTKAA